MCFGNVTNSQSAPSFAKTTIDFSIEERLLREVTMWKETIGYLRNLVILNCVHAKTIVYFHIFFTPRSFFCDYTFSYCMKPSGMCLHIYSLPLSAILKYQTSGLYCTWSKSHPLVDIRACGLGLGTDIHKKELYCTLASKKKSIPDWHLFITLMETKWTKWYAMTSHVIAYRLLELLFGTHAFHFNCFFEDFNCVFT